MAKSIVKSVELSTVIISEVAPHLRLGPSREVREQSQNSRLTPPPARLLLKLWSQQLLAASCSLISPSLTGNSLEMIWSQLWKWVNKNQVGNYQVLNMCCLLACTSTTPMPCNKNGWDPPRPLWFQPWLHLLNSDFTLSLKMNNVKVIILDSRTAHLLNTKLLES